jgi:hypothetical protein
MLKISANYWFMVFDSSFEMKNEYNILIGRLKVKKE